MKCLQMMFALFMMVGVAAAEGPEPLSDEKRDAAIDRAIPDGGITVRVDPKEREEDRRNICQDVLASNLAAQKITVKFDIKECCKKKTVPDCTAAAIKAQQAEDRKQSAAARPQAPSPEVLEAQEAARKAADDARKAQADANKARADANKAQADADKAEAEKRQAEADAKRKQADADAAEARAKSAREDARRKQAEQAPVLPPPPRSRRSDTSEAVAEEVPLRLEMGVHFYAYPVQGIGALFEWYPDEVFRGTPLDNDLVLSVGGGLAYMRTDFMEKIQVPWVGRMYAVADLTYKLVDRDFKLRFGPSVGWVGKMFVGDDHLSARSYGGVAKLGYKSFLFALNVENNDVVPKRLHTPYIHRGWGVALMMEWALWHTN